MKTTTIVIATLAVGIAVILSLSYATSAMGYPVASGANSQSRGGYGMMGNAGYGGMMGGYGATSSGGGYGGMMSGFTNGNIGYMGSMMHDAYGNITSWCAHFMSTLFGQGYSQK